MFENWLLYLVIATSFGIAFLAILFHVWAGYVENKRKQTLRKDNELLLKALIHAKIEKGEKVYARDIAERIEVVTYGEIRPSLQEVVVSLQALVMEKKLTQQTEDIVIESGTYHVIAYCRTS